MTLKPTLSTDGGKKIRDTIRLGASEVVSDPFSAYTAGKDNNVQKQQGGKNEA